MNELEMIANADRMWTSIKTFAFVIGVGGLSLAALSYGAYNLYQAVKATVQDRRNKKQYEAKPVEMKCITGLDEIDFRKIHATQEEDKKILYALKGMRIGDTLLPEEFSRN